VLHVVWDVVFVTFLDARQFVSHVSCRDATIYVQFGTLKLYKIKQKCCKDIERVKTWAATMKLDDDTAVELVRNGFTTTDSISLLTLEDIKTFKIPLGQQKMLMRGVEKTF